MLSERWKRIRPKAPGALQPGEAAARTGKAGEAGFFCEKLEWMLDTSNGAQMVKQ